MRKSFLVFSAIALIPVATLAMPAIAKSTAPGQQAATEALDLGAIPVRAVARHPAITGIVADDESDDFRPAKVSGTGPHLMRGEHVGDGLAADSETGELE